MRRLWCTRMSRFDTQLLTIFISLLVNCNIISVNSGSPPWLNICDSKGKHYYAYDVPGCPAGHWFKTPISDFCACGNGIWQFKSDYCGKDLIISAVDGDCYSINFPVRWFRHIGDSYNAYAEFYFVTDSAWDEIRPFKEGIFKAGYTVLGTINPRHNVLSCNEVTCYLLEKESDDVYRISDPLPPLLFTGINETDGFRLRNECPFTPHTDVYNYPGGVVKHGMMSRMGKLMNLNQTARSSSCKATCKTIPPIPYYVDTLDDTDPKLFPNCTEMENNYKDLPGVIMNQTHEQTVRMMRLHYDVQLKGKLSPEVNLTEYGYFQHARQIFEKVCPEAEAPPLLVKALLRMFRLAVNESSVKYPYRQMGDKNEDERIKEGLDKCLSGATGKVQFVYNETVCPKEFLQVKMEWPGSERNFSTGLPCDLQYNTSKYDYPTELAWKMVMFVHYFCAKQFEEAGFDHSRLEYKLRNLFNREIRHRWYKQGESAKLMEHVFVNYDLTRFKEGVDRCVAAARDASPYRKWIWRPKYIQYCGLPGASGDPGLPEARSKIKPNKEVWGGEAYCMSTFNEPILEGWARPGARPCFAKPTLPDCDPPPPPPILVLPPEVTWTHANGPFINDWTLIKCWDKVGDWMFEPGASRLCKLYLGGDTVMFSKNLTQFDGRHCWSPYYQFAYLCKHKEGLEIFTNLDTPVSKFPVPPVALTIPVKPLDSPGHNITDPDLEQCWNILGHTIFVPGNELICYQINFGDGMEPLRPPPLHLPVKPTHTLSPQDPRLEDPKVQKCYDKLGEVIFWGGNEELCIKFDYGDNVLDPETHPPLNQFAGKHCYSAYYNFAYYCKDKENLLYAGFPNLDKEVGKPQQLTNPPQKPMGDDSPLQELKDPDLKQCYNILGQLIFAAGNENICYLYDFGKDMQPVTQRPKPSPTMPTRPPQTKPTKPIMQTSTAQTDPNLTNPDQTDPNSTNPDQTDPNSTNPDQTDPNSTNTDQTDPNSTNPDQTDPYPTNPDQTDPNSTKPDQTGPYPTNPDQTDPNPTNPDQTDPNPTNPDQTDPNPANPGQTDPNPTNTGQTNANPTNTGQTNLNPTKPTKRPQPTYPTVKPRPPPSLNQFDGQHCYSSFYNYSYYCDQKESIINSGHLPFLDRFPVVPPELTEPPLKPFGDYPDHYLLVLPEVKQCYVILGQLIFVPGYENICYVYNFGYGMQPVTKPTTTTKKPKPTGGGGSGGGGSGGGGSGGGGSGGGGSGGGSTSYLQFIPLWQRLCLAAGGSYEFCQVNPSAGIPIKN